MKNYIKGKLGAKFTITHFWQNGVQTGQPVWFIQHEPGCNKVFVTRKQMEAHTLLHNSGSEVEKQKFHCNMGDCDNIGFTTKQAFEKHVRELYPMKQYRYKCHFCPKQFDVDRYRKTHEKKYPHNPQKQQFKYFYCEKLFSDKNNRNKHMKHVHRHGQL